MIFPAAERPEGADLPLTKYSFTAFENATFFKKSIPYSPECRKRDMISLPSSFNFCILTEGINTIPAVFKRRALLFIKSINIYSLISR